jgi:hypothetical protein
MEPAPRGRRPGRRRGAARRSLPLRCYALRSTYSWFLRHSAHPSVQNSVGKWAIIPGGQSLFARRGMAHTRLQRREAFRASTPLRDCRGSRRSVFWFIGSASPRRPAHGISPGAGAVFKRPGSDARGVRTAAQRLGAPPAVQERTLAGLRRGGRAIRHSTGRAPFDKRAILPSAADARPPSSCSRTRVLTDRGGAARLPPGPERPHLASGPCYGARHGIPELPAHRVGRLAGLAAA